MSNRDDLDARIRESIPKHGMGAERLHDALRAVLDECTAVSTKGDVGDGPFIAERFRRIIARELGIEDQ